jgi:hypothetical protein
MTENQERTEPRSTDERPQRSRFGGPQTERREGGRPGGGPGGARARGRREGGGGGRLSPPRKILPFCVDGIHQVD